MAVLSAINFTGYSSSYVDWKPIETKEDKTKKLLEKIDDAERLASLLKEVKSGNLSIEEAVEKIQEDKQFKKEEPFQWHTWQSQPITWASPATFVGSTTAGTTYYPSFTNGITR